MSDEDKTLDNSSEASSKISNKRVIREKDSGERLPKRPRMNLWEHQIKAVAPSNKDENTNQFSEESVSDEDSSDAESIDEVSLEELAASICCLPPSDIVPEELELYPWLPNQSEYFKNVYLYFRNKACMLWLKDPKNQLVEKTLLLSINSTSSDKYFQDIIMARLCNFSRPEELNPPKNQTRLNVVEKLVLKKHDIDNIVKDSMYKENVSKIAAMAIAFLERYGYANIGNFSRQQESYTSGSLAGPDGNPLQVIMIGAGLAGIMATLQLQYFGCKVVVLEAQDQPGGRLKTFQRNGFQVDVSPFSITGINNPVNQLIKQAGLSVSFFHNETEIVGVEGESVSRETVARIECEVNRLLAAARDVSTKFCMPSLTGSVSLGELVEALLALQMSHCRSLKKNSNRLLVKLLSRLQEVVGELEQGRAAVAAAHDRWQQAETEVKRHMDAAAITGDPGHPGKMDGKEVTASASTTSDSAAVPVVDLRGDTSNDEDDQRPGPGEPSTKTTGKLNIINPELQMKVNLALSEYRRVFNKCSPSFDEAVKIRKMIKLIHEYDMSTMLMDRQDFQIMDLFLANLEMRLGTHLNNLSVQYGGNQNCGVDLCGGGGEVFIKRGFQALINSLVRRSQSFHCSTVVKEISYFSDHVQVTAINTALSEDEPMHYHGNVAVCALPLGVLKQSVNNPSGTNSPQFSPPLPDWKMRSIDNMGFGLLDKVVLCFKERFWGASKNKIFAQLKSSSERRGDFVQFYAMSSGSGSSDSCASGTAGGGGGTGGNGTTVDSSDSDSDSSSVAAAAMAPPPPPLSIQQQQDDGNAVATAAAGDKAASYKALMVGVQCGLSVREAAVQNLSDKQLCDRAMESLRAIFRRKKIAVPEPCSMYVCRWAADPFTRGSVSFMSEQATPEDVANLAAALAAPSSSGSTSTTTETPTTSGGRTRRTAALATSAASGLTLSTGSKDTETGAQQQQLERLYFTGEHTQYKQTPGSIQAAMMSGLRVATQICRTHFPQMPNVLARLPGNLQFRKA